MKWAMGMAAAVLTAAGVLLPADAPKALPTFNDVTAQAGIRFVHNSGRAGKRSSAVCSACFARLERSHVQRDVRTPLINAAFCRITVLTNPMAARTESELLNSR